MFGKNRTNIFTVDMAIFFFFLLKHLSCELKKIANINKKKTNHQQTKNIEIGWGGESDHQNLFS